MLKQLIRQFHLTKTERCGAAALLLLAGTCWLAPELYRILRQSEPTDFKPFAQEISRIALPEPLAPEGPTTNTGITLFPFDPNTASVEVLVQLGLSEKLARTIEKYRSRGGKFRAVEDLQKIYTLPEADYERLRPYVRIGTASSKPHAENRPWTQKAVASGPAFLFDPNTASEQELLRLSLPVALVKRLLNYREKGGFFFEKTDFRKLYGLSEVDYQRLEPFIAIARSEAAVRPAAYAGGVRTVIAVQAIDVNTADAAAWQQLPGIGALRAQKIIRFREKLGGFVHPNQLAETRDLPDSVYQQIRPYLQMSAPVVQKINLNTANVEELAAHPYLDFKQGKLIVAYREQHGAFRSVNDLDLIHAFTDKAWLERVKPYLTVE